MLLLLAVISMACFSDALGGSRSEGAEESQKEGPRASLAIMQYDFPNASVYQDQMKLALARYSEDLNYSSDILEDYVRKNLTNEEAMVATASVLVLASQNLDVVERMKPAKEYASYHNHSLQALANLKEYLWNLAKFYETGKVAYAARARDHFNLSLSNYEKGLEEARRLA